MKKSLFFVACMLCFFLAASAECRSVHLPCTSITYCTTADGDELIGELDDLEQIFCDS